jgi:hypothetical protein
LHFQAAASVGTAQETVFVANSLSNKWLAQSPETMSLNAGYSRSNTRGAAASAPIAAARVDLAKAKL